MLTEDFKQQAFVKLEKASPKHIVKVLQSINSVQIKPPIKDKQDNK